jgi:hypothetical protein
VITATDKNNTFYIWCLFLLAPILSLLVSVKNIRSSWAKNILWGFIIFYGFTFSITADNAGGDINRYVSWFYEMRNSNMTFNDLLGLFYVDDDYADVLQPMLTFIVSRFTDNHAYLIAVFGVVFGYFYSRNLYYIIDRIKVNSEAKIMFLVLIFSLIVPFWNINGFRFWTATHMFFFCIMPFIFEKKTKYLLLSVLTIFVHFSFIVPVLIVFCYYLLGNRLTPFFYLFFISMFITEINITALNDIITSFLPSIFKARTEGYITEEKVANLSEAGSAKNWYAQIYISALRWSIAAFIIYIYATGKKAILTRPEWLRLFSFALFFAAISNIFSLLPSGGRFVTIANLFSVALIIFYFDSIYHQKNLRTLFKVAVPFLILYAFVTTRIGLASIGLVTVAGNPITALFVDSDVGLIDLIK